mmetsp:Transcript_14701/g.25022  ORF Transcript_14701/g.25022 Transcript_14701/m.25022 type:complete len:147 (+) Transcript_14701:625-1065(+)
MPVLVLENAIKLDRDLKRFKNKNKGMRILGVDSTSAPGNKTLQLAQICDKVVAFERDPKRIKTLSMRVRKANQKVEGGELEKEIICLEKDFLELPISSQVQMDETKERLIFVVCDPSCSGSGMNLHLHEDSASKIKCTKDIVTPKD